MGGGASTDKNTDAVGSRAGPKTSEDGFDDSPFDDSPFGDDMEGGTLCSSRIPSVLT
jgi:hypothetical protein